MHIFETLASVALVQARPNYFKYFGISLLNAKCAKMPPIAQDQIFCTEQSTVLHYQQSKKTHEFSS